MAEALVAAYFWADTHFGHASIIVHAYRPYATVAQMDEALVAAWNGVVKRADTIYFLGDLTLGNYTIACALLSRLQGRIKIVPGNHDWRWLKSARNSFWLPTNVEILPPLVDLKLSGQHITLCHYPMQAWNRSHLDAIHMHGHSHGQGIALPNSYDVGVDSCPEPVTLAKLLGDF